MVAIAAQSAILVLFGRLVLWFVSCGPVLAESQAAVPSIGPQVAVLSFEL